MDQVTKTSPFKYPAVDGEKVCTQCLKKLPLSSFGVRSKKNGKGIQSKCTPCRSLNRLKLNFFNRYGVSWDDYKQMYKAQQGLCYLCDEGGPERLPSGRPRLLLDHHHASGKVRKLLCNTCNWKVGILETTPAEWMTRARSYISDV